MTPERVRPDNAEPNSEPPRFQRSTDVVWRVTSERLLLRRVGHATCDDAVDLLGAAALTWVAAESAATTVELAAATGLDPAEVRRALDTLIDAGWINTA